MSPGQGADRGDAAGAEPAPLELVDLDCGYGDLRVVRGLDLRVSTNETVGITGPNGAGKTTLLHTIIGLLPRLGGSVRFHGRDISRLPTHQRVRAGIALVPEGRRIIGGLTVLDNLMLAKQGVGDAAPRASFDDSVAEVFATFPRLADRRAQRAGLLSGGEQQMLAIARALLTEPTVLLLDEPSQGLAPSMVRELGETLESLQGRATTIVVEQNDALLEGLAHRIGFMKAGALVMDPSGVEG